MSIIPEVSAKMQTILGDYADEVGIETSFRKRQRKISGSGFVQTVVFSWLANPDATYAQMSQTAAVIGVDLTPQAIESRFTEESTETLKRVLKGAVEQMIMSQPTALPILARFSAVYLHDSSWIKLPDNCALEFPGCGGSTEKSSLATAKVHLRFDFLSGAIDHLSLTDGRTNDKSETLGLSALPAGSIRIADLGYFSVFSLKQFNDSGVYWLTKFQVNTAVFDTDGHRMDWVSFVEKQSASEFECLVLIGAQVKLKCRLLVQRVSQQETDKRRRQIQKQAKSKGRTPSQARLKLAGYNLLITGVPKSMLSVAEAFVLYRVRWQIELMFKLVKSHGGIDEWRSKKKWRILSEIYAKLIAMVIKHWILLCGGITLGVDSPTKAVKVVTKFALSIAKALAKGGELLLIEILETIATCIKAGSRIYKRNKPPTTYQRLFAFAGDQPHVS